MLGSLIYIARVRNVSNICHYTLIATLFKHMFAHIYMEAVKQLNTIVLCYEPYTFYMTVSSSEKS